MATACMPESPRPASPVRAFFVVGRRTGLTGRSLASMEVNEVLFWFVVFVGGVVAPAALIWGIVSLIRRRRRRH